MKKLLINMTIDEFKHSAINKKPDIVIRLLEQADRYFGEELPKKHPSNSTTYMGFACANLSMAFILTEDSRYLNEAKRWINTVLGYEKWGNAHLVNVDLSASFILFGLSLSYNWLYESLDDELIKRIEEKLLHHAKIMYDFKVDTFGRGWSTNYWQNHNWINMSGLAIAGYALQDITEDSQKWIDEAADNFDTVFDVMSNDGSNYEGTVYWRYGVIWLLIYADIANKHGSKNYFETSEFLKNTFDYRLYQSAPNFKEIMNFGDCHDRKSSHSLAMYYKLAAEYNNGYAQEYATIVEQFMHQEQYESGVKPGLLPEVFLELIWKDPTVESKDISELPKTKFFEDLGLISTRSSWDKDAFMFSMKCSAPGGMKQFDKALDLYLNENIDTFGLSHHHPDNNSFILYNNGSYCFNDEGYNRNIKSFEHNNISVDGQALKKMDCNNVYRDSLFAEMQNTNFDPYSFKGEIRNVEICDEYTLLEGETANVYDSELQLKTCKRTAIVQNDGIIILFDTIESDNEHIYTQHFHTDCKPEQVKNKFHYHNKLNRYDLYSFSNDELEFKSTKTTVRAVMTTQEPDKFRETKMHTLNISNKEKRKEMHFITVIDLKRTNNNEIKYSQDELTIKCGGKVIVYSDLKSKIKIKRG